MSKPFEINKHSHPLKVWLEASGHSYQFLADYCQVTPQHIKYICGDLRRPSWELATKLFGITKIRPNIFMDRPLKGKARAA